MKLDEEKVDRRLHWTQAIIIGIVSATIWCVKLEMTTSALKAQVAQVWEAFGKDHDTLTRTRTDVDWLRQKRGNLP
jgi:hypothetical protein